MKKLIIISALSCLLASSAVAEQKDTLNVGYGIQFVSDATAFVLRGVGQEVMDNAADIDIAKALYGRIAGLNVYQGVGMITDNRSSLSIHGHDPLILVDGFPSKLKDVTSMEIESISILSDAVSAALYGMRGANGVVMIKTRSGNSDRLTVKAGYQYGLHTQFRSPEFADSYTYARYLNQALAGDGLPERYNAFELEAFRTGQYPYEYPNVDWWNEVYNKTSSNHNVDLSVEGRTRRLKYYTVVDLSHDTALFKENKDETRYDSKPINVQLSIRANLEANLTRTTVMRLGIVGKMVENNSTNDQNIYSAIYTLPSAAYPIKHKDGIYGASNTYTDNPVALIMDSGNYKLTTGVMKANMSLVQDLSDLTKGLSAEFSVALDNVGTMFDRSGKTYRTKDAQATISPDGTLITNPVIFGVDSEILSHSQSFYSLYRNVDMQAKIQYGRLFKKHNVFTAAIYDYQAAVANGRNTSRFNQSAILTASYTYDGRYNLNLVSNYSGSAYLPKGSRFQLYPAASAAWILSNEPFMRSVKQLNLLKFFASCGLSAWDGNLSHELYLQSYGKTNAGGYYFTNSVSSYSGKAEGNLPVENLVPERSERLTYGAQLRAFDNRLDIYAEGFIENRSRILVESSNMISGIIGIGTGLQTTGEQEYRGFDASISWNDRSHDFTYGIYANGSYVMSEIISDNQAYQQYDYLYTKGNRVGQSYGLEVLGLFRSQMEINNSPRQTFSDVKPGDFRYKDQNGDNIIDSQDVVKMYGSSIPRFYFGFGFNLGFKGVELSAEFQGITGKTVNLLNSMLYRPLQNNGTITTTLLENEVPWTAERASEATMPRLTTLGNDNNYRNNSFWYRDGSFVKLRDLTVSYNIPRKWLRIADMKVYVKGTNLFSIDALKLFDPEQISLNYPALRTVWAGVKFNF